MKKTKYNFLFDSYRLAPFQRKLEALEETDLPAACLLYTVIEAVYLGKREEEKKVFGVGLFLGVIFGLILAFIF
jgi:hypothetical protein